VGERFLEAAGPGLFPGVLLGDWLRLLSDNAFDVSLRHVPRAGFITFFSLIASAARRVEDLRFARRVREAAVPPPLFVIGHWRSGTTHLHNLLALDGRFAYLNFFQAFHPHHFLHTEQAATRLTSFLLPATRPQDDMPIQFDSPQEDEFALCAATGLSPYMSWAFPHRARHYDRYLTFRGVPAGEVACWKGAFAWLARKLACKYPGRPLVLKSPAHTARIRLLLQVFPGARFLHVHRDPYPVYHSSCHMNRKMAAYLQMQEMEPGWIEERVIRQYREMHEAFFEDRALVPAGCFHEVSFAQLEKDPLGQLRLAYEKLGLPDFGTVEETVRDYLASIADYRKNAYPPVPAPLRERLRSEWGRCFEEWSYPT
jgi:hypothetical protein